MNGGTRASVGRALALVLCAGAALRLYQYFANPSLSVDEAMLTVNVASRSFGGLLHPLWYDQIAPPLFLWAQRVAVLAGGVNERTLRLVPLLSGIVLPFAVWRVARRLVAEPWALLATAFAALSSVLAQYAVIAKPYATDALIAIVLLALTLDVLDAPGRSAPWMRLGAIGIAALGFSLTAAFVLAGSGLALALSREVRAKPALAIRLGVLALLWGGAFGLLYATIFGNPAGSGYMQAFWVRRFLTPSVLAHPARAWTLLRWLTAEAFTADRPLDWMPALTWLAAAGGVWHLTRRDPARGAAVFGPLVSVLLASVLGRYPIAPRVCLFAAPLLFILFAAAGAAVRERWPGSGMRAVVTGLVALFMGGVCLLVTEDAQRPGPPPARELVATLSGVRRPGQAAYVLTGAVPTWVMYTTDWRAPDRARLEGILRSQSPTGAAFHNAASRGRPVPDTAGAALVFHDLQGPEVIGLSVGMQWREGTGFSQPRPDVGWARREAARMLPFAASEAAGGVAWLALTHIYPNEAPELIHALAALRGKPTLAWTDADGAAALYRIDFAAPPR